MQLVLDRLIGFSTSLQPTMPIGPYLLWVIRECSLAVPNEPKHRRAERLLFLQKDDHVFL